DPEPRRAPVDRPLPMARAGLTRSTQAAYANAYGGLEALFRAEGESSMGFRQIVHSRPHPGAEHAMLALRPQFVTALRAGAPGLGDARPVRLDDGTWLEIGERSSRAAAEAATAAHAQAPEAVQTAAHLESVIAVQEGDDAEPA